MNIKVQIVIESDVENTQTVENLVCLERGALRSEDLGLTLAEAKDLLNKVQHAIVAQQIAEYLKQQAYCPVCGKKRLHKGNHRPIVYRTLFGKLHLRSERFYHCECRPHKTRTFSPLAQLLTKRTAPELLYLESKFAALMSYGLTADLLQELLPTGKTINAATIRSNTMAVSRRIDQELGEERVFFIDGCERDWEQLPRPDLPLTVGIDGGYVHSSAQRTRKDGWFEVIAGMSVAAQGEAKRFAFVHNYDDKPKRRVYEVLKSQGMQANQQVTFLSDGAETVRNLQLYLNPNAEHILDWFHMRVGNDCCDKQPHPCKPLIL